MRRSTLAPLQPCINAQGDMEKHAPDMWQGHIILAMPATHKRSASMYCSTRARLHAALSGCFMDSSDVPAKTFGHVEDFGDASILPLHASTLLKPFRLAGASKI